MMLDSAPSDAMLGTYSAILQVARTLGFVVSPILGGWVIQSAGSDYNVIWLVMAGAQLLALVVLLPVTRGEAR
jgi:MFS family permease